MHAIATKLDLTTDSVDFYLLNSFDTQQQFINMISEFLSQNRACRKRMLLVQCDLSDKYSTQSFDLISCARHCVIEQCKQRLNSLDNCFIVFLLNLQHENIRIFSGKWLGRLLRFDCFRFETLLVSRFPSDLLVVLPRGRH